MTANTIYPSLGIASDEKRYKQAISILDKQLPDIPENLNLDDIINLAKKTIYELSTDIDFCEDKHQTSLYALEWLFEKLYQNNIPLERIHFFSLCSDLILKKQNTEEEEVKPAWYRKI